MARSSLDYIQQVNQFRDYLQARRDSILNQWRTRCSVDASLHTRTSFSREEFNDQLPVLLNILSQRIIGEPDETDPVERSGQHGLHRWQRGYSLAELLNELTNLYDVIEEEIHHYLELYPRTQPQVIAQVHRQLLRLSNDISLGSLLYYDQLRQTTAAEQVQTLELALDKLHQLTKERGDHLRQASHDLRGRLGVVSGAARLLQMPAQEEERELFLDMLNRNLKETGHMLTQLLEYARLEAIHEIVESEPFDAAELIHSLVQEAGRVAKGKDLILNADGPEHLPVVGDALKVQRLVRNLLVNALKYTKSGWVSVSWAMENDTRWLVSVQDSGSGLGSGPTALLAEHLQPLSQPTSSIQAEGPKSYPSEQTPPTRITESGDDQPEPDGDGIGLFIAKGLCELMKGSMDIETSEQGTLIRVRLLVNQKSSEQGR